MLIEMSENSCFIPDSTFSFFLPGSWRFEVFGVLMLSSHLTEKCHEPRSSCLLTRQAQTASVPERNGVRCRESLCRKWKRAGVIQMPSFLATSRCAIALTWQNQRKTTKTSQAPGSRWGPEAAFLKSEEPWCSDWSGLVRRRNGNASQLALPSCLLPQLQNELKIPALRGCREAWRHVHFSTSPQSSCVCKPVWEEEEEDGWLDSEQLKGFS